MIRSITNTYKTPPDQTELNTSLYERLRDMSSKAVANPRQPGRIWTLSTREIRRLQILMWSVLLNMSAVGQYLAQQVLS